ncbi:MAG: hypothetical protein LUQ28_15880 [Methylococcaceae bacterium]|nr:hypothetical protein [Methylococcaceae bacterium]
MATKKHPGFAAIQEKIAASVKPQVKGQTKKEAAGAILASAARKASPAAKKANPFLKRVK